MSSLDKETRYWRSLDEQEGTSQALERLHSEFPSAADIFDDPPSRRRFMQLMGASLAFAGAAGVGGCRRWEEQEIVPLAERPEGYVPGVVRNFATAMEIGGVAQGLLATSHDGRPTKVEGNNRHPFNAGTSSVFAQASVLGLYDPDRSLNVRQGQAEKTWGDVERLFKTGLEVGTNGATLRILSEASSSPTMARLRERIAQQFPMAKWYEYEPLALDNERLGLLATFGQMANNQYLRTQAKLHQARRILTVDCDALVSHPAALRYARAYASGRRPEQARLSGQKGARNLTRLYAVESSFTNTGAMADHRLPVASSEIPVVLAMLEAALNGTAPTGTDKASVFVAALAKDLQENHGQSVVVVGQHQPPAVHSMVARINQKIDAVGRTLEYILVDGPPNANPMENSRDSFAAIAALAKEMNAGVVKSLLILGGNPVYDAPADAAFATALEKVKTSIHLSHYFDETSAKATWHLPRAHYLESWGDARSYDGTVTMIQPLIEPLTRPNQPDEGGRTAIEVVALLLKRSFVPGQELVKTTFDEKFRRRADGDKEWQKALHDGYINGTAYRAQNPRKNNLPRQALPAPPQLGAQNLEVVFTASSHTHDGRFANNAWLHEIPNFITKLTWDNPALINPNTADELGIKHGEIIELSLGGKTIKVAAATVPGQAKYSIGLVLGHGRTRAGQVAGSIDDDIASIGFDVNPVRTSAAPYIATGATVKGTGKTILLAGTQSHWKLDKVGQDGLDKRLPSLIREGSFPEFQVEPNFAKHRAHEVEMPIDNKSTKGNGKSMWEEHRYDTRREGSKARRYKWGMAIDMDRCTGCNACLVACQAENNIPVVGKEQVAKSREMHWIRIDRYFSGPDLRDNPQIAFQPVNCQQCEMAPCEQVCPVGATLHSHEGLNDMVYNRCVGTRYCANNCPYKVRRFNYLDFLNRDEAVGGPLESARNQVRRLLFNPEVTVRSRGVMEKCTFCVQRIQNGKIAAKNAGRKLRDGEVQVACQQACPSDAIFFGDLNNKNSKVFAAHRSSRSFELLSEFNNKPRNHFLARIRNPNPELG